MATAFSAFFKRLRTRLLPRTPDFFGLLAEQSRFVSQTLDVFVEFMESGDPEAALKVRNMEHQADRMKAESIRTLNEAFSTPMDREDIYRAIGSLDEIINYCKTTVREMESLELTPDKFSLDMAFRLKEGTQALEQGFKKLPREPEGVEEDANLAHKAERRVEKIYRRALAQLFQGDDYLNMLKRRELYRHLSNAADRMADASHVLLDIVVKIS